MGRNKLAPKTRVGILMPDALRAELYLLRPELIDPLGFTKYGKLSEYVCRLIREDLQVIKDEKTEKIVATINADLIKQEIS